MYINEQNTYSLQTLIKIYKHLKGSFIDKIALINYMGHE